jgi:hypothetical protein
MSGVRHQASGFRTDGVRRPASGVRVRKSALRRLLVTATLLSAPLPVDAQLQISGQVEALALNEVDTRGLNRNFRNDSPFSSIRARLFAQHWVTDRIGVFAELLYDIEATAPRLNGAYLVINEIGGYDWLSVRAGMAPTLVGNFGLRSTYFNANPLIGVPAVHQHRTTLDGSGLATADDLARRRASNIIGLPMMYDACWNPVAELLGNAGRFEYSVGVTNGSVSNPLQTRLVEGVQVLARLGFEPVDGLRFGASGVLGPYIGGPKFDPLVAATSFPGEPDDYDQRIAGVDAEWLLQKFLFYGEAYVSEWQAPLIEEDLVERGAYVEGRYDFLPEWFAALRVDALQFSDVTLASGEQTAWDDDIVRVESSLTYRVAREVHLRADWQHTSFTTGGEQAKDLVGLQLRAVF